jgi:hypothetical protein
MLPEVDADNRPFSRIIEVAMNVLSCWLLCWFEEVFSHNDEELISLLLLFDEL